MVYGGTIRAGYLHHAGDGHKEGEPLDIVSA